MSASKYILSIDLGTGGPKVALVCDDGSIATSTNRPIVTQSIAGGGSEQDPEEIWRAILDASAQVITAAGKPAESIVAVACSSQYFSIVPIDAKGLPVSNLILWMDSRGGRYARQIYSEHPDAFMRWIEIAGMPPLPSGSDSLSHMLFVKHERPEVYDRTHVFVEAMDYVTARLTGNCTANPCTAFAQLLTDNRKLDSIDYCDELIAMAGIDRDKLPRLVEMGSSVGVVQKEIAEAIGLAADTTVFAGINDTQAVAVGAGTFRGSHGGINIGTTCQVLGFVDHMHSDLANGLVAMPGPIPGRYTVMAENGLGGKTIEHFLTNIVFASDPLADHSVEDPFAGMEATLETTRAGSRGTLYLPWLAGASSPQSSATTRGGFLNVSLKTTRADMLRSVLEGVAMSLRWLLPAVETFSGTQFDALRFAGGGARSATWSQIFADVMNRPVLQLEESRQANNRGCALLAFDRLGIRSLDDIEMFCPIQQTYEPIPENRDLFAARFEQFVAVFEQTRPIFEALNG